LQIRIMFSKAILITIIALSLAGLADSGYALRQHYAEPGESACNVNATVNCDTVNQSKWSEIIGIPVAGIGMAGYAFFIGASVWLLAGFNRSGLALLFFAAAALAAFAYSSFLTMVEVFVLGAVCPMCIISMTLVTAITILLIAGIIKNRRTGGAV
jgi:uncharacterized membrane protein